MYKSQGKLKLKKELKELKNKGEAPDWITWMSYYMLKDGYLLDGETPKGMFERISKAATKHLPEDMKHYEQKFFDLFWKNWLCGSTPVLTNFGANRGMPVSCSASYVDDTMWDIAYSGYELEMLSSNGFGTAVKLDVRPGFENIASGGVSNHAKDWVQKYWYSQEKVSQGGTRRGATCIYMDFFHKDLPDVLEMLETHERLSLGVTFTKEVKEKLLANDKATIKRYNQILTWRAKKGKPFLIFLDNVNNQNPQGYKDSNLLVKQSNLCSEITLFTDSDHTLSCVLSSMNCMYYDEWKNTDAVETATIFLDCVAEEMIQRGKTIKGLDRIVRHTEKGRALGLGLLGFHEYLQSQQVALDGPLARGINREIFKHLRTKAEDASRKLAARFGEPLWCKGTGLRNTHLLAIAPNTSSAFIAGSTSEGIGPWTANVFTQNVSKGKVDRVNPQLVKLLKSRGKYTEEVLESIAFNKGSVQHLDFLTDFEKQLFKTAFEINQKWLIDLADDRQEFICQSQSLNLFFVENESKKWIREVHKHALMKTRLKSLYYVRSMPGITADKGDCVACES